MTRESEYKKIYIQESDELLSLMNKGLLVLEREPANSEALNSIFRSAHTLKSMSASMGFAPIAELAHKMEDVLDALRSQKVGMCDEIIDTLFKSFDALDSMVKATQEGRSLSNNFTSLLDVLDGFLPKGAKFVEDKISAEISLNEFDKKTLARVKRDGYFCYHVKVTLEKNCVLKSVRVFMIFRNLHEIGEVIKSFPDSRSIEEEKFDLVFGCLFITKEKKKAVEARVIEVLDVEKAEVNDVAVEDSWLKESSDRSVLLEAQVLSLGLSEQTRRMQSVRVDITRLDKLMNLAEELAIAKLRLAETGLQIRDPALGAITGQLAMLIDDLQLEVMQARLVPVEQIFDRFPRFVRDLAKKEGKKIKFEVVGGDIELDRTVLDEIGDPLIHILRNSVDHGIETVEKRREAGKPEEGRIVLAARREKSHVFIEVKDDGRGMDAGLIRKIALKRGIISEGDVSSMSDADILLLATMPGFSTRAEVTDVSGRGVGLDVVKQKAESLGGGVFIESKPGQGSTIGMRLPVTTAVVHALLARAMNEIFAVPISSVVEIVVVDKSDIKEIELHETILHRREVLPIVRLEKLFAGTPNSELRTSNSQLNVVIVEYGSKKFGIVVEKLVNQQNIVIKQLTRELKGIKGFAGATILGDGSVALVLDVATLI